MKFLQKHKLDGAIGGGRSLPQFKLLGSKLLIASLSLYFLALPIIGVLEDGAIGG